MQIDIKQLEIPPGNRVRIKGLSWEEFEQFLDETGDGRHTRIWYHEGVLEMVATSAEHEVTSRLFNNLINSFCKEVEVPVNGLGSTTFTKGEAGVEPDECFYFGKNATDKQFGNGKAPDLVIEIDNKAKTKEAKLDAYAELGVAEVWIYDVDNRELSIRQLQDGKYPKLEDVKKEQEHKPSLYFPDAVVDKINESVGKILDGGNRFAEELNFDRWTRDPMTKGQLEADMKEKLGIEKAFEQQAKMQATKEDTKQNTLDATNNTSKDLSACAKAASTDAVPVPPEPK